MANHVGAVLEHCETCRAFDKTPRVPIAGASAASMFNGKVQVDLLSLSAISSRCALRICFPTTHCFPEFSPRTVRRIVAAGCEFLVPQEHPEGRGGREEE